MISTDRKIFEQGSAVRARQVEYAKEWEEVHIVVFDKVKSEKLKVKSEETSGLHTSYLISPTSSPSVLAPNCWAYSTQSWSKFKYSFDAMRLGRFIIARRGITNITCQDSSLTAMAGVALKKENPSLKLEIQIHEDIGSPNFTYRFSNRVRKMMALTYIPKADSIRVVSNRIKNYLVDSLKVDGAKITVKPIVVDVEKIKNTPIVPEANLHLKYPQFEKIVLMASRLTPEKNIQLAISAWPEVLKEFPKAGLIIVGEGSMWRCDLQGSILFESWADQSTLISYYKTADVFLNTSLFEGYGMTLVEAQAACCKIVSTDVGVAREVGARIVGWNTDDVARGIVETLR